MITKQMILSRQLFLVTQKHIQRDQFTTVTKMSGRFLWAVSLKWIKNMQHEQFPMSTIQMTLLRQFFLMNQQHMASLLWLPKK